MNLVQLVNYQEIPCFRSQPKLLFRHRFCGIYLAHLHRTLLSVALPLVSLYTDGVVDVRSLVSSRVTLTDGTAAMLRSSSVGFGCAASIKEGKDRTL